MTVPRLRIRDFWTARGGLRQVSVDLRNYPSPIADTPPPIAAADNS